MKYARSWVNKLASQRSESPCVSLTSAQVGVPDKGQHFDTDFLFRVCLVKHLKCFVKPGLLQTVFHILIATAFQASISHKKSSCQLLETRRSSLNSDKCRLTALDSSKYSKKGQEKEGVNQVKWVGKLHSQDDTGTKTLAKAPPEPQRFTWSSSATQPQHTPHVRVRGIFATSPN